MTTIIDEDLCKKVLNIVDKGLVKGLGEPEPGKMCVEAAVNYALGLEHNDRPKCVGSAVCTFKIVLNDSSWSSDLARTKGLYKLSVAQLGSNKIYQTKFTDIVVLETIKQILPIVLEKTIFRTRAKKCRDITDLSSARDVIRNISDDIHLYANTTGNAIFHDICRAITNIIKAVDYSNAVDAYDYSILSAEYIACAVDFAAVAVRAAAYNAACAANDAAAIDISNISPRDFYKDGDAILQLSADIALKALIELKSPGTEYLYLCDEQTINYKKF